MKPEEIHINDWMRIFVGNVPGEFYIELFIRCLFFYLLIIMSMRLMGKRMSSQLSRTELASLVALAAAIGIPLAAPDRGIIPGLISCIVIVLGERMVSRLATRNQKMQRVTQGHPSELVKDGVIQMDALKEAVISRDRLVAQLRSEGLKQLGSVKRFYIEENGSFTLIKDPSRKEGLNILPVEDESYSHAQNKTHGNMVCDNCGMKKPAAGGECRNCGNDHFSEAIQA